MDTRAQRTVGAVFARDVPIVAWVVGAVGLRLLGVVLRAAGPEGPAPQAAPRASPVMRGMAEADETPATFPRYAALGSQADAALGPQADAPPPPIRVAPRQPPVPPAPAASPRPVDHYD